jgi:hypothetical protein
MVVVCCSNSWAPEALCVVVFVRILFSLWREAGCVSVLLVYSWVYVISSQCVPWGHCACSPFLSQWPWRPSPCWASYLSTWLVYRSYASVVSRPGQNGFKMLQTPHTCVPHLCVLGKFLSSSPPSLFCLTSFYLLSVSVSLVFCVASKLHRA